MGISVVRAILGIGIIGIVFDVCIISAVLYKVG